MLVLFFVDLRLLVLALLLGFLPLLLLGQGSLQLRLPLLEVLAGLLGKCRSTLAAPVEQKIHFDDCSLMLLRQVAGECGLPRLLRADDHDVELVFFLDRRRVLHFEPVLALLRKSCLELSLLLRERVPPLRYFFLRPWRRSCLACWIALLLTFGWRLIERLLFLDKVCKLLLQLRQLLPFLFSPPLLVVLLAQRRPELAARSTER